VVAVRLVGIVALASAYELLALPGDALWHEIFGIDLTAWSPPHVTISLMMAVVLVGAAAMLVDAHERERVARPTVPAVLLCGLALNVLSLIGVLEWELPVALTAQVAAGNTVVVLPQLALRTDLPALTAADQVIAMGVIFAGSIAIALLASLRPTPIPHRSSSALRPAGTR